MIESKDVLDILLAKIKAKQPYSLIRLGDGEMAVLNGLIDPASYNRVLVRQLGLSPTFEDAEKIRQNLITAISDCDMIGLPFGKEKHGGYWADWDTILDKFAPQWRNKQHCHIDVHNHFLDNDWFDLLLKDRATINFIGCRQITAGIFRRFAPKVVNPFFIRPEMAFTSEKRAITKVPHYPEAFGRMQRYMDSTDLNRGVCLVGAGFVGKIYNNWFRDRGCVSMDIGNVMDAWGGKRTRGEGRGRDVEFNDFKL